MVPALCEGDRAKCVELGNAILRDMEDDNFLPRLIFGDETIFCISGKIKPSQCSNMGTRKFTRDFITSPWYQEG